MAERAGLGSGRRQVVVPAQPGRAISVSRGDLVRVIDIEVIRSGTCGRSIPPITAAGCRSVTPVTCASGCSRPSAGSSATNGHAGTGIGRRHLAWRPPHVLPAVRPVTVREPGPGRPPELPGQLPGRRGVGRHCPAGRSRPGEPVDRPGPRPDGTLAVGVAASSPADAHRPPGPRCHPDRTLGRPPAPEPGPLQPAADQNQPRS
jgi:hypothetical protein